MLQSSTKRLMYLLLIISISIQMPFILASSILQYRAVSPRDGRDRIPRGHSVMAAARSDYRPWKPLLHGNPLARDPTLFYLPPMIERFHVGYPQHLQRNPIWPVRPKNPSVLLAPSTKPPTKVLRANYQQMQLDSQLSWNKANGKLKVEPFHPDGSVNKQQQRSDFLAPVMKIHRRNDGSDYPRNNTRNENGTVATVTSHHQFDSKPQQRSTQRKQRNRSTLTVSDFFIQQGHSKVKKFGS